MNGNQDTRKSGKNFFSLKTNSIISAKGKNIRVHCYAGAVLVTWPPGHEQVVHGGQSVSIFPRGKVCILALMDTFLQVQKIRWNLLGFFSRFHKLWKTPVPNRSFDTRHF